MVYQKNHDILPGGMGPWAGEDFLCKKYIGPDNS